ncbi:MAG: hypothetical protein E6R07_13970 [Nevskiaceae bacterium]|nr:MAG: hypothetical protein E6R07_13970 [Nevskiaceae bacterium]
MSGDATAQVQAHLRDWFENEDAAALDAVCALAQAQPVDVAALLRWIDAQSDVEATARDLALRRVRRALGLPMMPGAPCRPFAR